MKSSKIAPTVAITKLMLKPLAPGPSYEALKAAGVPMLGYGQFATAVVNFLILAFVIYQLVRVAGRFTRAPEAATPAPSDELLVLREIRNRLPPA